VALTINRLAPVFACLNSAKAKYLVIGGIAVAACGVPRATEDLDLAIDPTRSNARRVLRALAEAGLGTATLIDAKGLLEKDVTMLRDRLPVDVLARAKGLDFRKAWKRRVLRKVGKHQVPFASLEDLIAMKRAAGRPIDRADLEYLERIAAGV
jgi:hypothetical protein